jgi:hypothetical protein
MWSGDRHRAIAKRRFKMNGKTNKMTRRLSVFALAASITAVAVPAATAGPDPGDILGTGIVLSAAQVQKHQTFSPSVVDWFPQNTLADDWFRNIKVKTLNPQDILRSAALEHGSAGFGNTTQAVRVLKAAPSVLMPSYWHLPGEDRP